MKETLLDIISRKLGIEKSEIDVDADIYDVLGADSLEAVDMLIELEDTLNVSIPDEDAVELRTVRDVAEYLEEMN